jgi:hypothetical protein
MEMWYEVVSIAESLVPKEEEDEMIWQFNSSGVYSSQFFYDVMNFRGVIPFFTSAVCKLRVPPRMHFFLWLVSKNKLVTRDNLEKRRRVDDKSCLFCSEDESTHHLFFDCVVAEQAWNVLSEVFR